MITEPPSKKVLNEYDEVGKKIRRALVGKVFSQDWLDKVEKAVEEYRKSNQKLGN
jgi:hypothetical protein